MRTHDDVFRLRLMRARFHQRALAAFPEPGANGGDGGDDWSAALDELALVERLAPPSASPSRFRRIAERWLAIWAHAGRMDDDAGDALDGSDWPDRQRYAAYLRANLARLDDLAVGADGPG